MNVKIAIAALALLSLAGIGAPTASVAASQCPVEGVNGWHHVGARYWVQYDSSGRAIASYFAQGACMEA
ncbi:hypothetical protein [Dyella ginsengisoli]|uniref:hypothetical protein n=1 Tax=Dyella ginsengisoli TaxID=363848 RepID=UPI000376F903|nr:hypothetical protein [Dyella ginsengisoli]